MASIYSYPLIDQLADQDTLVISDVSNRNKTKSVTIKKLSEYFGTSSGGVDNYVNGGSYSSGTLTLTRTGSLPDIDISGFLEIGTTSTTALAGNTTTITPTQATNIATNNAKVSFPGFGTTAGTALQGNTTTISTAQANEIAANTLKTSFPGFGTTAGTALEGNTALLQIGTTAGTALEGDTPVVEGTTTGTGGISAITEIRTLTLAEYSAITPAADVMYVIV